MINKAMIVVILLWVQMVAHAQCRIDSKAFAPGEVITYKAYYNWGFIWLHAGEVEFNVTSKRYGGRDVYHLYALGTSLNHTTGFSKYAKNIRHTSTPKHNYRYGTNEMYMKAVIRLSKIISSTMIIT